MKRSSFVDYESLTDDKLKSELRKILRTMNIPDQRINKLDIHWINRNIAIRNSSHPEIRNAKQLIRVLIKRESEKILNKGK